MKHILDNSAGGGDYLNVGFGLGKLPDKKEKRCHS